jgi:nucleoside 2-deoxyribosyltransferase
MKERIYLSGPITGMPDQNKHAFREAQLFYENLGFEVDNPHEIGAALLAIDITEQGTIPAEKDYMASDIMFLSKCNLMAVLPGFERSLGASFEIAFASAYGIPIVEAYTNNPLTVKVNFNLFWTYTNQTDLEPLIEDEDDYDLIIQPLEITNYAG